MSSVLGFPLMGGASSLATRLLQRYIPTPLEKAQMESIHASMAHARAQLAMKAADAEKEWEARRALLLTQIEATSKQDQDRDLMQRWPLTAPAAAMVRASQKRAGQALNTIVIPNTRHMAATEAPRFAGGWGKYDIAVDRMQDSVRRYFANDVLFYWEVSTPRGGKLPPRGQGMSSTVQALTVTEPTALIQFSFLEESVIQLSWSSWGWAGDDGVPDSGALHVSVDLDDPELDHVIERALMALICALSDRFQFFRDVASLPIPRFIGLKPVLEGLAIMIDGDVTEGQTVIRVNGEGLAVKTNGSVAEQSSAIDALIEDYMAGLDRLAKSAPALAADRAADAALRCMRQGEESTAERLLGHALSYHREALIEFRSEDALIAELMQTFFDGDSPLKLQLALRDVLGLSYSDFVTPGRNNEIDQMIFTLGYFDNPLTEDQKDKVRAKLEALINYQPTVGITGKAGAGKSSLGNALFGKEAFKVGHTVGTTRKAQDHGMDIGAGHSVTIYDMPGVGESEERDKDYKKLYREWLPKFDLLFWAIKSDDRSLSVDEYFFREVVKPQLDDKLPLIIILTQADLMHPVREWRVRERHPGPDQLINLEQKRQYIAKTFSVDPNAVIAVSAIEKFNLQELTHLMISMLPNEKRLSMVRGVYIGFVGSDTAAKVKSGVDDEMTATIGNVWRAGYERDGVVGAVKDTATHVWRKFKAWW